MNITPNLLTLNGFTIFDIDPGSPTLAKQERLTQFAFAAENFRWMSNDLISSCPFGNARNELVRLLHYYSVAMRRGYVASNFNPNRPVSVRLRAALNAINNNLVWSGVDLNAFPAGGVVPPAQFTIPNQSPLELLVKARMENVPAVVTVGKWKGIRN